MRLQDQKIKQIRVARKVSKADLADAMYCDIDKVNKVEKGLSYYPDGHIQNAKKYLDIVDMPLTQFECDVCENRLYIMRDYAREGRHEEAKAMCKEKAKLVNLDACDDNLPMLYRLLEVIVLIQCDDDVDGAEKKMNYLHDKVDKMTDQHKYYYYFNMATLHIFRVRYEEGLSLYKKALDIGNNSSSFTPDDIERAHLGIAVCYSYLGFPNRAIFYLRNTRELFNYKKISILWLYIDTMLALNYIRVSETDEARKLLDTCLVYAKSLKNDHYYGWALYVYGVLNKQTENWDIAIDYFNQSMECYEKGSRYFLRALYENIRCVAEMKNFAKALRIIEDKRPLFNNHEIYATLFEALRNYVIVKKRVSIYNERNVEYLETIAIPYFIKTHEYFLAIDYYKLLEAYYDIKNKKKSLLMSEAIRKIYERCFVNSVDIERR